MNCLLTHTFNVEMAEKIGLCETLVLTNIYMWLTINRAKKQNHIEGEYWTYNTYESWHKLMPYIKERLMGNLLRQLEKDGYLKTNTFNKMRGDKTKWYTLTKQGWCLFETKEHSKNLEKSEEIDTNLDVDTHSPNLDHGIIHNLDHASSKIGSPIPSIYKTIEYKDKDKEEGQSPFTPKKSIEKESLLENNTEYEFSLERLKRLERMTPKKQALIKNMFSSAKVELTCLSNNISNEVYEMIADWIEGLVEVNKQVSLVLVINNFKEAFEYSKGDNIIIADLFRRLATNCWRDMKFSIVQFEKDIKKTSLKDKIMFPSKAPDIDFVAKKEKEREEIERSMAKAKAKGWVF